MSFLSNLFNGAQNAANAQITGIDNGLNSAVNYTTQGDNALQTNYASALAPYLSNYSTAQAGTTGLLNALGLGGAQGNSSALSALQSTPGYQFQQQQGNSAINAAAAANGTLNSGNQATALSQFNQGLAGTTYNNYVSQLEPFLGASSSAASGISGVDTGLGSSLNSNLTGLGNDFLSGQSAIGGAQANADLSSQQTIAGLIKGIAGLGTSTVGGSALTSLGSGLTSLFSDERLKEDIEPVGELYDGTNVYSYKYIGDDVPRIGVMAQEVERRYPEAVTEIGGFKAVDYGKATGYATELGKLFKEAA